MRTHAILLSLLLAPAAAQQPLSGSRPNIVFVFSDDHAAHAIGAYGSVVNETPNIDRLASEGVLFRNCFCGNSICGPSRATILTGLHSHANGFMRNGNRFDGDQPTFPKLLQRAGYQTAMIGKWHLSSDPQGFDHWMVLPGQGQYYNPDFLTPEGRVRIEGYCTDITTDLALDWLRGRDPERPFVLMCQHKAPHRTWMPGPEELGLYRDREIPEPPTLFDDWSGLGPAAAAQEMTIARHMYLYYDLMLVPEADEVADLREYDRWWKGMRDRMTPAQLAAWDAAFEPENRAFRAAAPQGDELVRWKYQRYIKNYLRCVAGVDKSVGRILEFVDADPELAANTIVIYSSDQGFYLGDRGWYDKRWMYDESLRMPLLARWPARIAKGQEVAALAQNIDFAPTFLDLAGVPVPEWMHGMSLVPLLEGRTPDDWRDAIYYHYYESHAVHEVAAHYGVRTATHKLIRFYEPRWDYQELFDLVADPGERHSVARDPEYAEIRTALEAQLDALRARYGDTTGRLGGGHFDLTAGLASVERTDAGWRVWANTSGSYLLRSLPAPIGEKRTITCDLRPADAAAPGDACLVVAFGDARQRAFRARVDFAEGELSIRRAGESLASAKIAVERGAAVRLRVEVDPAAGTFRASARGESVAAKLPPRWREMTAIGYGASNTTSVFSDTVVSE